MRNLWFRSVLFVTSIAFAGCTVYGPLQMAESNRPVTAKSLGSETKAVKGESCQDFLLGIPLGKGNTLREALDAAKSSAGSSTLTDVSVDVSVFFALVYASQCTIVHGVPARN